MPGGPELKGKGSHGRRPWENDMRYFAMDLVRDGSGGFAATYVERRM